VRDSSHYKGFLLLLSSVSPPDQFLSSVSKSQDRNDHEAGASRDDTFEGSDGNDDDNDDNDDSAESSSRRRQQQLQQQQRRQALAVAAATLALPVLRLGQQKKAARSTGSAEPESESAWTILRRGSSDPMDLAGLLAVLSRSPRALHEKDSEGRVPLHEAIRLHKPVKDIEFLIRHCPESIRAVDHNGDLPLHVAAHADANVSTIRLLVRKYPEAVRVRNLAGDLPLHRAASAEASRTSWDGFAGRPATRTAGESSRWAAASRP
jgi:ankyrin repeat protein